MAASDKALKEVRVLHAAFLVTVFLFVWVVHLAAPPEEPVSISVIGAFACVAVGDIAFGVARRKQYMNKAAQALQVESDSRRALAAWRVANIFSFVHAETVVLFGLALKFLGASWKVAGPFFLVGFALLLLWTPRMELAASANAAAPPPRTTGTD